MRKSAKGRHNSKLRPDSVDGHQHPQVRDNAGRPEREAAELQDRGRLVAYKATQEKESGNSKGDHRGRQFEDVEVVVDTGSTYTAVPRELLQRLGVLVERSLPSKTADGRLVPVDVGRTTIRLEGLEFSTPVIFAEEGEPSLLGVVSLEEAALAVDPLAGRLIPANLLRLLPDSTGDGVAATGNCHTSPGEENIAVDQFMEAALEEARTGAAEGGISIGAALVDGEDRLVATALDSLDC